MGVTGFVGHLPRAKEIAAVCRREGVPVVIGGAGVTRQPHSCYGAFDYLILGEAELTWPQFLNDWQAGRPQRVYRQIGSVDMALTPAPRWDSLAEQAPNYNFGAVQTSRGCPFDCEFCDVSVVLGSRYRVKPVDNVMREVANLEKLGLRTIIFCDDNFVGNTRYAKELLRELIPLNNSFSRPLRFGSEMSINMAKDEELLELLADANFAEFFVGIESPNKESLKEAGKFQNFQSNLVEDVRKIQSYGVPIRGALIVGFDHDGKDIFDRHVQFTRETCIPVPSVRILMAAPETKLWRRLRKEGRLLKTERDGRFFGNAGTTNIIPKGMSRVELQTGFLALRERIYSWEEFAVRAKGFISNVKRRPRVPKRGREWKLLFQFVGFLLSKRVDRKTRRIILSILRYTHKKATFMLPRVARIILRNFSYADTRELREVAQNQIDQEQSGTLVRESEQSEILIPEDFRASYEDIFAEINKEVYQGLNDKTRSSETLIEIFTKFLRNWNPNYGSFSADDKSYLMELTEHTVTSKNNPSVSDTSVFASSFTDMSAFDQKKDHLSEQILRAVEQELLIERCGGILK